MSVPRLKFELVQGATFQKTLYWYSGDEVAKPITAVTRGYPTIITAPAHGMPASALPVAIIGATKWLNTPSTETADRIYATKVGADTFSLRLDTTANAAYVSGSHVLYVPPVDLSLYTAAMQLRATVDSATVLKSLTSAAGDIVLGADGSIQINISATDAAGLTFPLAVSQLELTLAGVVTRLFSVEWTLSKESTR